MLEDKEKSEDESMTNKRRITISLPPSLIQKIKHYAESKNIKRSKVIAQALEGNLEGHLTERETKIFKKLSQMQKTIEAIEKKISNNPNALLEEDVELSQTEEIESLFRDCTTFDNGFELEGEGFYTQVEKRGLIGEIWTDEILKEAVVYFHRAYRGYTIFTRPDINEMLKNCSNTMKLSSEQRNKLFQFYADLDEELTYEPPESEEPKEEESDKGGKRDAE